MKASLNGKLDAHPHQRALLICAPNLASSRASEERLQSWHLCGPRKADRMRSLSQYAFYRQLLVGFVFLRVSRLRRHSLFALTLDLAFAAVDLRGPLDFGGHLRCHRDPFNHHQAGRRPEGSLDPFAVRMEQGNAGRFSGMSDS